MSQFVFDELREKYPLGSVIEGSVRWSVPDGLLLRVEGGLGIIRWREVPGGEELDAHEVIRRFPPGAPLKPLVIGADLVMQRLELSLVRSAGNFERHVLDRYRAGSVWTGRVKWVRSEEALVELEPGVAGHLSRDEIPVVTYPREGADHLDKVLWDGDIVRVVVKSATMEKAKRQPNIILSVSEYVARRRSLAPLGTSANSWESALEARARWGDVAPHMRGLLAIAGELDANHAQQTVGADEIDEFGARRMGHVLVVDGSEHALLRLGTYLSLLGYSVNAAQSIEGALPLIGEHDYDYLFVDVESLDGTKQEDTERLFGRVPVECVTLIGEPYSLLVGAARSHGRFRTLSKPVAWREVVSAHGRDVRPPSISAQVSDWTARLLDEHRIRSPSATGRLLENVRRNLGADSCILFDIGLGDRGPLDIRGQAGHILKLSPTDLRQLSRSAIGDIIRQGRRYTVPDVASRPGPFRYLRTHFSSGSFLGVPVRLSDGRNLALTLLADRVGTFSEEHEVQAELAAQVLAMLDDRLGFLLLASRWQKLATLGELEFVLLHELRHWLSGIGAGTRNVTEWVRQLNESLADDDRRKMQKTLGELRTDLQLLENTYRSAVAVTRQVVSLGGANEESRSVDVGEVIRQVVSLIRPFADLSKVEIHLRFEEDLPRVRGPGSALSQAFLNLAMNAVQQIDQYLHTRGGELVISARYERQVPERPVHVRFADTGPGIHASNLSRLFQFGFTTREGGTGIGLFVTNAVLEAAGGRITVEDTGVLGGTTFLIELPEAEARGG